MNSIPEKYLNKNVRAMLSGREKSFQEKPNFHFSRVVSFLRKIYQVEVKIFIQDINNQE